MADVPTCVQVGPHRITLVIDDEAAHNAAQVAAQDSLYGRYDPFPNTITVAPGLSPDQQADTILHELLHAVTANYGLRSGGPLSESADEEQVIAALAPALLDLLRRNPDLVTYLLEEHTDA